MTNIKKIFAIVVLVIFTVACSNEEQIADKKDLNKTAYNQIKVYNSNNPYDEYAAGIESFYINLKTILSNIDKDTPYYVYEQNVNELINSIYPAYPATNSIKYSDEDKVFLSSFINNYLEEASSKGIVNASLNAENILLKMETGYLQNDLLCFISQVKYNFYYLEEIIIYYAPNYEDRHRNCIGNHLDAIFNDNIAAEVIFIATLPESFLYIAAECAYLAIFEPNHPDCQGTGWLQ